MTTPPYIAAVDVFPTLLPLSKTFTFASGSTGAAGERAPHVFVRVTSSDGQSGWGEARPVPAWSYETLETVTTTLRRYLAPAAIGLPITDRRQLHQRMFRAIGRGPSAGQPIAKCALDMALHDLCSRAANLPLRAYLGGSPDPHTVTLSYTVTPHTPDEAAADVTDALKQGYHHFNFKAAIGGLGGRASAASSQPSGERERAEHAQRARPLAESARGSGAGELARAGGGGAPRGPDPGQRPPESSGVDADISLAEAIRAAAPQDSFLWADANQGYRLHHARLAAAGFLHAGVNLLEQPLPADQLPLLRQLRAGTTLPLAVDESSVGPSDFLHHVREGLVDYLVIKLARSAGCWPTLQQLAIADAAGLPFLISGLTETLLAKIAACQVAAVYGFEGPAALNGTQFIDQTAELALFPTKPELEHDGTVHLPLTPGIGVEPALDALKTYAAAVS